MMSATVRDAVDHGPAIDAAALAELRDDLDQQGYAVRQIPSSREQAVPLVLGLARAIGSVFVPGGCDELDPIIRTAPTRAKDAAPFDRPEAIGWHGDFSTRADRPEISLVYITRPDPRGGEFGAWRLASVDRVIERLCSTVPGREAFAILRGEQLPFSYADGEEPQRFSVIEERSPSHLGLRFYGPAIRRGCEAGFGHVPTRVHEALKVLEQCMDDECETVPTQHGSLLVVSNWFGLHDRVRQSVGRGGVNREALLCFVAKDYPRVAPTNHR
jgi:hypothetical protein